MIDKILIENSNDPEANGEFKVFPPIPFDLFPVFPNIKLTKNADTYISYNFKLAKFEFYVNKKLAYTSSNPRGFLIKSIEEMKFTPEEGFSGDIKLSIIKK